MLISAPSSSSTNSSNRWRIDTIIVIVVVLDIDSTAPRCRLPLDEDNILLLPQKMCFLNVLLLLLFYLFLLLLFATVDAGAAHTMRYVPG